MHLKFDESAISVCLKNLLSLPLRMCVWCLFHFLTTVYVATTRYTFELLHLWLLHPEWCTYNLLMIFLLPECLSVESFILWIWQLNNWNNLIVDYLEAIIEIESPESFHPYWLAVYLSLCLQTTAAADALVLLIHAHNVHTKLFD